VTDIVNAWFHKHYPPDLKPEQFRPDWYGGSVWQRYEGPHTGCRIFPGMVCADGFSLSVQGHFGGYCYPGDDFANHYETVEVFCVSAPDPILNEWARRNDRNWDGDPAPRAGMDTPMNRVPIAVIERVIAAHGGLVP